MSLDFDLTWIDDYNNLKKDYKKFSSKELEVLESNMNITIKKINQYKKQLIKDMALVKLCRVSKEINGK